MFNKSTKLVRAIGTMPIGTDKGDSTQVSAVAMAISVKSFVLFFIMLILALIYCLKHLKYFKKESFVMDTRENFDRVIDILIDNGLSEDEAIGLFYLAIKESNGDEKTQEELEEFYLENRC